MTSLFMFVDRPTLESPPRHGLCEVRSDLYWLTMGNDLVFRVLDGRIIPQAAPVETPIARLARDVPFDALVTQVSIVYMVVSIKETFEEGEYRGWDFDRILPGARMEEF